MAYCPKCRKQVGANDRFCTNCGSKLPRYTGDDKVASPPKEKPLVRRRCPPCKDTDGADPRGFGFSNCPVCHGRKYNLLPENMPQCINCGGTGIIQSDGPIGDSDQICGICGGKGYSWNR
jgi:hypothetical protein